LILFCFDSLKYITLFHQILQVLKSGAEKVLVPDGYERAFELANRTFLHQIVYDHIKKETVHLMPLPADIENDSAGYLGKHHPQEVAQMIADGKMDPIKLTMFSDLVLKVNGIHRSFTSPISISPRKGPAPSPTNLLRRSDTSVKSIASYFTPVSVSAQKPFKPPLKRESSFVGNSPLSSQAVNCNNDISPSIPPNKRRKTESAPIVKSRFFSSNVNVLSQSDELHQARKEEPDLQFDSITESEDIPSSHSQISQKESMDKYFTSKLEESSMQVPRGPTKTKPWFESSLVTSTRLSARKSPNFSQFQMTESQSSKLKSIQNRFSTNRRVSLGSLQSSHQKKTEISIPTENIQDDESNN
jgi:hypothetical protein